MDNDFILVLDLGGPEAIEMARKLRNLQYYTEIMSRSAKIGLFRKKAPRGILVVGGDERDDAFPKAVLSLGVPVLALGGAARAMIESCGAVPEGVLLQDQASQITFEPCPLFDSLSDSDRYFARVDGYSLPEGFISIATTIEGFSPAFADLERRLYGLQFYAESNDPDGAVILSNFAEGICGCTPIWTAENFIEEETRYIRDRIGDGSALMAVSGGVDSSACAMLMKRAIGDRLKCVFIDNGLLREGEAAWVTESLQSVGIPLIRVDARDRVLNALRGVVDPVEKHRAVYGAYTGIMSDVKVQFPEADFLVQGTIYPDLLLGGSSDEVYARRFDSGRLLEPIRMLFKEEARRLGELLGLPQSITSRQSFPNPGLAVRCVGEVTEARLKLLRRADAIFREEVRASGQDKRLSHYFTVLSASKTLGRRDGTYDYEYACVLRAVTEQSVTSYAVGRLPYDLLDRVAGRIIAETPGINRVSYDVSPCDNAAIEWE